MYYVHLKNTSHPTTAFSEIFPVFQTLKVPGPWEIMSAALTYMPHSAIFIEHFFVELLLFFISFLYAIHHFNICPLFTPSTVSPAHWGLHQFWSSKFLVVILITSTWDTFQTLSLFEYDPSYRIDSPSQMEKWVSCSRLRFSLIILLELAIVNNPFSCETQYPMEDLTCISDFGNQFLHFKQSS